MAHEPRPQFSYSLEGAARLGRLVRKELLEILRDRRTILTLVLMPVLLYPLLTVAFQQFIAANRVDPSQSQEYRFGFESEEQEVEFTKLLREDLGRAMYPGKNEKKPPKLFSKVASDLESIVRAGEVDVGLRLPVSAGKKGDRIVEAEAVYLPNSPGAIGALAFLDRLLAARNLRLLERRLDIPGAKPSIEVLKIERKPLAEPGPGTVVSLAALVPLILILMTITGAVYPAIDLTAGERERGTLEILVAAPVPRLGLLFAKYVSVWTVAVLTALVNLLTMTVTLKLSGMGHLLFGTGGWSLDMVAQMFGLLLLFAAFFSAVLLCLTSFARSFKEAQAYLIPLMLASLAPGLMGMIPGLKLENLAFAPLINIVLLARDLFEGGAEPVAAFLVVVSTLLYSLVALSMAARIFGAEGVLYNDQSGWSDLFRRPRQPQPAATVGSALTCLALLIPSNFVLQSLIRNLELTVPGTIAAVAIATVLLFVGIPLIATSLGRVEPRSGLGLRMPSILAALGGLLLGFSLWPYVLEILLFLHRDSPAWWTEQAESMLAPWREAGRSLRIGLAVSLAVVALAEELFFRGLLFGSLERSLKPAATIGLTAVLFGLMHCLVQGGMGFEQLLPATLLGLVLGTLRWLSGSVLPGMLLHATHNVILSLISGQVQKWKDQVPGEYLVYGAIGILIGTILVALGRRSRIANHHL